jgi:DNA-binding response OmpR family regulator
LVHRPPTRTQTSLSETATQNGGSDLTRARVDLLSSITQEFRVPLGLILGPLEELVAAPASRWTAHERAQIAAVHRNSFRLFRLVNTLLDLSRLDDVGGTAEDGVVDVSGLTLSITNSFRAIFEQGGVELAVECDALPPMRSVSSDTWEKIVLNLLSNAFKFTRQGRIEVALRGRETQIELSVRDTGAGIPVAEIPHLFHPFHRYKEPLARNQDGVGLGLARVGELVRLCRGTIRVDSEYGRGSTFVVSVPADPADLEAAGVPTPRAALATTLKISSYVEEARSWLTNRTENSPRSSQYPPGPEPNPLPLQALPSRILVVVENADVRDYLLRLLSGRYAVEAAANGEAAFSAMGERRPDLIIASTPHSGQGGLELLARVRAREGSRLTPFILLSQNPTSAARVAGLSAGADDYLVQPFSARELLARVAAHLEMARLRNEAARSDAEHAVERQRLYEAERIARKAAQRAADRTARLQALTAAFSRASTPEAVAEVVTLQGVAAIGATSGTVYLLGEDTSSLERLGAPGATSDSSDLPADSDAAAALAVRTRAPQFPDLAQGRYAGTPLESIAAVPLLVGDKIIGRIYQAPTTAALSSRSPNSARRPSTAPGSTRRSAPHARKPTSSGSASTPHSCRRRCR